MAVFEPIQGVPQFLADGTQSGTAPTGYAPGTIVQLLGEQLSTPQPLPPQTTFQPQQAANVFQPLMDSGFDGMDGSFGGGQQSGSGNVAADLGVPSSLSDPIADFGVFADPTPFGLGLSALGAVVPGLAPLGLAYGVANAIGSAFGSPQSNSMGQTQQSGVGNATMDMFGNVVGSPENVASVASFSPDTGPFTSEKGEPMSPAPNPDVSTPNDYSASADQSQAADPTGVFGDTYGESTAEEGGSSSGGGVSVICTELHRQGKLDDATMAADKKFGENVAQNDPHTMIGYHCWALPIVRQMRKSKIITFIVSLLALPWAREMYFRQTGNGRGSYRGRVLMAFGIPVCRFIGRRRSRGWFPPFRD